MDNEINDNDAARHELVEALALVQEHMSDLAVVEEQLAALSATAGSADGTVTVTVNAQGVVCDADVDETYFDDHELADLGDHITVAAQAAAREVGQRSAELLAPLAERRARFPSLSEVVDGAPDIRDLLAHRPGTEHPPAAAGADGSDGEEPGRFPTVRSQ